MISANAEREAVFLLLRSSLRPDLEKTQSIYTVSTEYGFVFRVSEDVHIREKHFSEGGKMLKQEPE